MISVLLWASAGAARAAEAPGLPPEASKTADDAEEGGGAVTSVGLGLGEGVNFRSADRALTLQLRLRTQLRAELWQPYAVPADHREGFAVRRMRLLARGQVGGARLEYYVQLGFAAGDMEPEQQVPLRDAYLIWRPLRDLHLRVGQQKVPFARQRRTSSGNLQLADRSIATAAFQLDRDVGVVVGSSDLGGLGGRLAYQVGAFGGEGRNQTRVHGGLLWVARLSCKPMGAFDDLVEADLARHARPKLAVAGAWAYHDRARRARATLGPFFPGDATADMIHQEVDIHAKFRGISLLAEWLRRSAKPGIAAPAAPPGAARAASQGDGVTVQLGWVLPAALDSGAVEIVGRYSAVRPAAEDRSGAPRSDEAGGGLSWYIRGHDAKVQLEAMHHRSDGRPAALQVRLQAQLWL